MDEIIKKMEEILQKDYEVFHGETNSTKGLREMYFQIKQYISDQPKPLTVGDKIRESNESLAEAICDSGSINCFNCPADTSDCGVKDGCLQSWINFLNQPIQSPTSST